MPATDHNDLSNFPAALMQFLQSSDNLSPRGLQSTFTSNVDELETHSLDTYLS